jgi:hypothetical protein
MVDFFTLLPLKTCRLMKTSHVLNGAVLFCNANILSPNLT